MLKDLVVSSKILKDPRRFCKISITFMIRVPGKSKTRKTPDKSKTRKGAQVGVNSQIALSP